MTTEGEDLTGSFDNRNVKILDTNDYSLIITVDKSGYAEVSSFGVSRENAAIVLRMLADGFAAAGEPL